MGATSFLGRDAATDYSKVSFHFCTLVQRGHPIIFVVVFSGLLFPFVLPCLSACSLNCLPHFHPVLFAGLGCLLLFPTLVYFSLFSFFEGTEGLRVRAAVNNEARRARADSSHPT